MANKLKDVFSNKMIDLNCNLRFENPEAYKNFLEVLKIVEKEGRVVEVEGVSSISTKVKSGNCEYPFSEADRINRVYVGPVTEQVPITLQTDVGEKTLVLTRFYTTSDIILETDKKDVVYLKLIISKESNQTTVSYRTQSELAKSMDEIVEKYSIVVAFLNYLFVNDIHEPNEEYEKVKKIKKYFNDAVAYFKRVKKIEEEFKVHFNPAEQNENGNDEQELEELYSLLYENMVFRCNAKLNGETDAEVVMKSFEPQIAIGKKVEMTFSANAEFNIYGQKISIYTANLLVNVIIKDIKESEEGKTKIWYGDTDSEPMFFAYSGFKTVKQRDQEVKKLMENRKKYLGAVTLEEYLMTKYSE